MTSPLKAKYIIIIEMKMFRTGRTVLYFLIIYLSAFFVTLYLHLTDRYISINSASLVIKKMYFLQYVSQLTLIANVLSTVAAE